MRPNNQVAYPFDCPITDANLGCRDLNWNATRLTSFDRWDDRIASARDLPSRDAIGMILLNAGQGGSRQRRCMAMNKTLDQSAVGPCELKLS